MEPQPIADARESEVVRCLDCAGVYAKPLAGGTISANPGCPRCGYLGWMAVADPLSETRPRGRSGADLLRGLSARPR